MGKGDIKFTAKLHFNIKYPFNGKLPMSFASRLLLRTELRFRGKDMTGPVSEARLLPRLDDLSKIVITGILGASLFGNFQRKQNRG